MKKLASLSIALLLVGCNTNDSNNTEEMNENNTEVTDTESTEENSNDEMNEERTEVDEDANEIVNTMKDQWSNVVSYESEQMIRVNREDVEDNVTIQTIYDENENAEITLINGDEETTYYIIDETTYEEVNDEREEIDVFAEQNSYGEIIQNINTFETATVSTSSENYIIEVPFESYEELNQIATQDISNELEAFDSVEGTLNLTINAEYQLTEAVLQIDAGEELSMTSNVQYSNIGEVSENVE